MGDFYPGINEPIKPLKLPLGEPKYFDDNSPAFRRDDPTEKGQLWLDTKVNFLNEIMKFLPRATTNTLIEQKYDKDNIKNSTQRTKVAESVYNKDIFEDIDNGLWKGNQSNLIGELYVAKNLEGTKINLARFAGVLGLPFDGNIGIGTYIVNDEDNNAREVTFMEETDAEGEGVGKYYMQYNTKNGVERKYDITTADTNYLVPIIQDLKGDDYAKNFREGVNFHASIVDFQHTNASYDSRLKQFVVDVNGDGYADGSEGSYDSLSTTALDTARYQSEYLQQLGVYSPVLDYSDVFSDLMSGSLFSTDSLDRKYYDADKENYNKLHTYLGENDTSGEFKSFMEKISFAVSKGDDTDETFDYVPNIYDIARKGIDFSEQVNGVDKWTDKDIFYLSMMMMESKRRYTYAMSSIFGVQDAKPDIKDILVKYTDPDIWKCDDTENYLYMDVSTVNGGSERMYNYFIPIDVGQNITDPTDKKIEKLNWLNKRSIEYLTNEAMYTLYQESMNRALKENKGDIPKLVISNVYFDDKDANRCISDLNSTLTNVGNMVLDGKTLNETQLAQLVSLVKEAKDWLAEKVPEAERKAIKTGATVSSPDGTDYLTVEGKKIYYMNSDANSDYANKWNDLNNFITKINETAASILLLQDKAGDSSFIQDYFNNRSDISSAIIYKKDTNGNLEVDDEQKDALINNTIETARHYFNNYKSNVSAKGNAYASATMEKVIDMSFSVNSNSADVFSILSSNVNNQERIFNDINMIDKFHYIQYGTVRNVDSGIDETGKTITSNLYEKGILDMGYYPERIARTTAKSPYLNEKNSPDSESYVDGSGQAQYETNMVDKMYFSMIAEMQKMNNFYMMTMFASPTDMNDDGKINDDDKLSDLYFAKGARVYYGDPGQMYSVDSSNRLYDPFTINGVAQTVSSFNLVSPNGYKAIPKGKAGNQEYDAFEFLDDNPSQRVELPSNHFPSIYNYANLPAGVTAETAQLAKVTVNGVPYYDIQFTYMDGGVKKGLVVRLAKIGDEYIDVGFKKDIAITGSTFPGYTLLIPSAQLEKQEDIVNPSAILANSNYLGEDKFAELTAFLNNNKTKYSYNAASGKFTVKGKMTPEDESKLKGIFVVDEGKIIALKAKSIVAPDRKAKLDTFLEANIDKYTYVPSTGKLTITGGGKMTSAEQTALIAIFPEGTTSFTEINKLESTHSFDSTLSLATDICFQAMIDSNDDDTLEAYDVLATGTICTLTRDDSGNVVTVSDQLQIPLPSPLPTSSVDTVSITDVASAQKAFKVAGILPTTYDPSIASDWSVTVVKYGTDKLLYEVTYNVLAVAPATPITKSVLTNLNGQFYGMAEGSVTDGGLGYRYNFLDPLKASATALVEDERAYLQSSDLFAKTEYAQSVKSLIATGTVTENGLVGSMDKLADNIYDNIAKQLYHAGIFDSSSSTTKADGESYYEIKTMVEESSSTVLTSPYDVLSTKITNYLKGRIAGASVKESSLRDIISVYCTQVLKQELSDKGIIDNSGYLLSSTGGRITTKTVDAMTLIENMVLSKLSPLFTVSIGGSENGYNGKGAIKESFKGIINGSDFNFSEVDASQGVAMEKRELYSKIVAGAVDEDYKQIGVFVGSLYERMSAIDFSDTGDNNAGVSTNEFSNLDFTDSNTIPPWMHGFATSSISDSDIDNDATSSVKRDILKKILINEGIILEKTENDVTTYMVLQGIDPKIGLNSFEVLIREGYTDAQGNEYTFTRAQINTLIDIINNALLGTELSAWLNGVKNIEYSALGLTNSKLKVSTKDTLLSMFVSRDFVSAVKEVKKCNEAKGFNWVDGSDGSFTGAELNNLWTFVTLNIPSNILGIKENLPTSLTKDDGVIPYEALDMVNNVINILEKKWSVADNANWVSSNGVDYANAIKKNSVFSAAAQADWGLFTDAISSAFTASNGAAITIDDDLSDVVGGIVSNYSVKYKVTYSATYDKDKYNGKKELTDQAGTMSVSGTMVSLNEPSTDINSVYPPTIKNDKGEVIATRESHSTDISFTSCTSGNIANNGGDSYNLAWANGIGGDLAGGGYSYLPGNNKNIVEEYARDFTTTAGTSGHLDLSDFDGDGSVNSEAITVYDALLMIRDRARANIGYVDVQLGKFNHYASQVTDMLQIGAGDNTNKGKNSLEELFKNEFYMKDNFDPLILGSEFQSRFVENAFVSEDGDIASNADSYSMVNRVGWYETAGRLAVNSASADIVTKMDLSKFNYSTTNDYITQYETVKAKMTSMKYSGSQGKDNIRSTMERAMRDEFSRTLVLGDFVFSHAGSNATSFKGNNVEVLVHNMSGSGVGLSSTFVDALSNVSISGESLIMDISSIENDIEDRKFSINTVAMQSLTFEEFKALEVSAGQTLETFLQAGDANALPPVLPMTDAEIRQLYDFLSNIGWNNVSIGTNLSSAHSIIELNSIYMEVILARIMVSIVNDELNSEYERRKEDYDEQIAKKKDEEVATQMADSKRSAFKSYLKSISRKK